MSCLADLPLSSSRSPSCRPLSNEIVLDKDGGVAGLAMADTGRRIIAWTSTDGVFIRKLVAPDS
jgi:hypothetical protein